MVVLESDTVNRSSAMPGTVKNDGNTVGIGKTHASYHHCSTTVVDVTLPGLPLFLVLQVYSIKQ